MIYIMGVLYKLTFPNGKVYIGMTTLSLRKRLYCHKFKSKSERPKLPIHRAWKLHGEPISEVLAIVEDYDLPDTEMRAIQIFNSYGVGGYNSTPGGETSPMNVPEVVEKVRLLALTPKRIARNVEIHLGSKRSESSRKRISESLKGVGLGVPKSLEHRRKISEANKGKIYNIGRKNTIATKSKMSESAKLRWSDPDIRLKMLKAIKTRKLTAETREKLSLAGKKRWSK